MPSDRAKLRRHHNPDSSRRHHGGQTQLALQSHRDYATVAPDGWGGRGHRDRRGVHERATAPSSGACGGVTGGNGSGGSKRRGQRGSDDRVVATRSGRGAGGTGGVGCRGKRSRSGGRRDDAGHSTSTDPHRRHVLKGPDSAVGSFPGVDELTRGQTDPAFMGLDQSSAPSGSTRGVSRIASRRRVPSFAQKMP